MNNKLLIGTLTVFAAICTSILLLNISKSKSVKDNYFERKFSKNEFLIFEKNYSKLSKNELQQSFGSGNTIFEIDHINNLTNECDLISTDFLFIKKINSKIIIPNESNILAVGKKSVFYSFKKMLYKLNHDSTTINKIKTFNFNVSSLVILENFSNKCLFLGEFLSANTFKIGFFILNLDTNEITTSKLLYDKNESFKPEIVMKYAGDFQKTTSDSYAYTCEDNSKIYLFNENGVFKKEFNTKDKTPLPNTFKDSHGNCYFSRNGSKYTNSGILIDRKSLFVFSMASPIKDKIIIDQYSKTTQKYIQSFKLNYKNHSSLDIENIYLNNGKIILKFESGYASFKFSRYNDGNFY